MKGGRFGGQGLKTNREEDLRGEARNFENLGRKTGKLNKGIQK